MSRSHAFVVSAIATALEAQPRYVADRLSALVCAVVAAHDDAAIMRALLRHIPNAEVGEAFRLLTAPPPAETDSIGSNAVGDLLALAPWRRRTE